MYSMWSAPGYARPWTASRVKTRAAAQDGRFDRWSRPPTALLDRSLLTPRWSLFVWRIDDAFYLPLLIGTVGIAA